MRSALIPERHTGRQPMPHLLMPDEVIHPIVDIEVGPKIGVLQDFRMHPGVVMAARIAGMLHSAFEDNAHQPIGQGKRSISDFAEYRDFGNIGFLSTETPDGQKRMIIRPFAFDGVFDETGNLTDLTTGPDTRDIAWKPDYLTYHCSPEAWKRAWKIGAWNTLRVRIYGKYPKITTWINNTKVAEFDGETCPHPNYNKEKMFETLGWKVEEKALPPARKK